MCTRSGAFRDRYLIHLVLYHVKRYSQSRQLLLSHVRASKRRTNLSTTRFRSTLVAIFSLQCQHIFCSCGAFFLLFAANNDAEQRERNPTAPYLGSGNDIGCCKGSTTPLTCFIPLSAPCGIPKRECKRTIYHWSPFLQSAIQEATIC